MSVLLAIGVLAKIIDLVLPDKKGMKYDYLQKLLSQYSDALGKGQNSKATRLLVQLKAELRKIGYTEEL